MKNFRGMVGLLLAIALQCSAAASMADGFGCLGSHSHREHAVMISEMPQQHDHAAMHMVHASHAGDAQKCDCPLKCDCANHCMGGSVGAAVAIRDAGLAPNGGIELHPVHYRGRICGPQTNPPFRPPIATAPGAA